MKAEDVMLDFKSGRLGAKEALQFIGEIMAKVGRSEYLSRCVSTILGIDEEPDDSEPERKFAR